MGNAIRYRALAPGVLFGSLVLLYVPLSGPTSRGTTIRGVVAGVRVTAADPASPAAIHFRHAHVCLDANENGVCDRSEASAFTDDAGAFVLTGDGRHSVVAEIPPAEASAAVPGVPRLVFRAARGRRRHPFRRSRSRRCRPRFCA